MEQRLILASGSPRRRELLQRIGLHFEVIPSGVSERVERPLEPSQLVQQLAYRKALAVANSLKCGLIIGADTVVVQDGEVLGKPADAEEAKRMLTRLQGRTHAVYSGVAVVDAATGKHRVAYNRTEVKMRALTSLEIDRYVATGEPLDKAGAYAIQGRGALLIEAICGDYFTVVGLPLFLLATLLSAFGVHLLQDS